MKKLFSTIVLALFATSLFAANIDGKWQYQVKTEGKKKGGKSLTTVLDLKQDGGKLTGTVSLNRGKRDMTAAIENGKLDGDNFSFSATLKSKKGERTMQWSGSLAGGELKGKQGAGKRGTSFTAKKL